MSRLVKPELVTLPLPSGDSITINRELNLGQKRRAQARTVKPWKAGQPLEIDMERTGIAELVAYLVDWTVKDGDGNPIPIRDATPDFIESVITKLDEESFDEMTAAINAHLAALAEEKKTRNTGSTSSVTSGSVA